MILSRPKEDVGNCLQGVRFREFDSVGGQTAKAVLRHIRIHAMKHPFATGDKLTLRSKEPQCGTRRDACHCRFASLVLARTC